MKRAIRKVDNLAGVVNGLARAINHSGGEHEATFGAQEFAGLNSNSYTVGGAEVVRVRRITVSVVQQKYNVLG
jgi:hypothetical protein